MNGVQPKIFVINLKRSIQRRDQVIRQMELFGLHYEFVEGVDGSILPNKFMDQCRERSNRWYQQDWGIKHSMKPGEIGVALSHYKIYQKIVHENVDFAIIMEDDANFDERFRSFISRRKEIIEVMKKFDLILLGYCTDDLIYNKSALCSYWGRMKISTKFTVGIPVKWYWSAIGYLISKKGALLLSEKQGQYPCVTADILTANSPEYGVRLGVINKPLIWPGKLSNFSTIQVMNNSPMIHHSCSAKNNLDKSLYSGLKALFKKFKSFLQSERLKLERKNYPFITNRY